MKFCRTCSEFFEDDQEVCPNDGSPLASLTTREDSLAQQLVGQTVDNRFLVRSLVASGGMGAIYRAVQTSVNRDVALKVVLGDPTADLARRFLLEARTTSQLTSVHTVTTLDFGLDTERSFLFLALEYLEGEDLRARIARNGPLPWRRALHITRQIAMSLEEAHGKGIVHRDLKSANVYLVRQGADEDFVKVLDFGIALLREGATSNITRTGAVVGTPEYMAPEQAMGERLDGRADLYALGVTLYEMLTGRLPFQADLPMTLMLMHCQDLPAPVDPDLGVPSGVLDLVADLLQKRPSDRPQDARAVQARCAALLESGGEPVPATGKTKASATAVSPPSVDDVWSDTAADPRRSRPDASHDAPSEDDLATVNVSLPPRTGSPPRSRLPRIALLGGFIAVAAVVLVVALVPPSRAPASRETAQPSPATQPSPVSMAGPPAHAMAPTDGPAPPSGPGDHAQPHAATAAAASPAPTADGQAPPSGEAKDASAVRTGRDAGPSAPDRGATAGTASPADALPGGSGTRAATLRLESSPRAGAAVYGPGGRLLGRTPLEIPVPRDALRLTVRLRGFQRKVLTLQAGAAGVHTVRLRRTPKSPPGFQPGPRLLDR